jgi:hypothetical protein
MVKLKEEGKMPFFVEIKDIASRNYREPECCK